MKRKNKKATEFDVLELVDILQKSKKDKSIKHNAILHHPHQIMRWWLIDGRNIKRYEYLYYKEKGGFSRLKIIEKTKNIELLGYAMVYDKDSNIRRRATIRFAHLVKK